MLAVTPPAYGTSLGDGPSHDGPNRIEPPVFELSLTFHTPEPPTAPRGARATTAALCRARQHHRIEKAKAAFRATPWGDAEGKQRELVHEDENRRLKKLLAESMLDVSALKDLLGKN